MPPSIARLAEQAVWLYFRVALSAFFRDITVSGAARVPSSGPVLLLPNHLNAFVDPLLIRLSLRRDMTITAKSPLAARPLFAPLMRLARVIPFHRALDQGGTAVPRQLAMESFTACQERLADGAALCVFPEGVSHEDPLMRPFKPGPGRIALDFIAQGRDLAIVPVGLNFEAKEHFRSRLWLRFGPPLDARGWLAAQPAAQPHALMAEMRGRVGSLIVELPGRREGLVLRWAAGLLVCAGQGRTPFWSAAVPFPKIVMATAALRDGGLPGSALYRRARAFRGQLRRLGLNPEDVFLRRDPARLAGAAIAAAAALVLCGPFLAWGAVMNALPAAAVTYLTRRRSHLPDLWASNAVFFGLVCFPPAYIGQVLAASAWLPGGWLAVYALSLPVSGYAALLYYDRLRAQIHDARALWTLRDSRLHAGLRAEAKALLAELRQSAAGGARGDR